MKGIPQPQFAYVPNGEFWIYTTGPGGNNVNNQLNGIVLSRKKEICFEILSFWVFMLVLWLPLIVLILMPALFTAAYQACKHCTKTKMSDESKPAKIELKNVFKSHSKLISPVQSFNVVSPSKVAHVFQEETRPDFPRNIISYNTTTNARNDVQEMEEIKHQKLQTKLIFEDKKNQSMQVIQELKTQQYDMKVEINQYDKRIKNMEMEKNRLQQINDILNKTVQEEQSLKSQFLSEMNELKKENISILNSLKEHQIYKLQNELKTDRKMEQSEVDEGAVEDNQFKQMKVQITYLSDRTEPQSGKIDLVCLGCMFIL